MIIVCDFFTLTQDPPPTKKYAVLYRTAVTANTAILTMASPPLLRPSTRYRSSYEDLNNNINNNDNDNVSLEEDFSEAENSVNRAQELISEDRGDLLLSQLNEAAESMAVV